MTLSYLEAYRLKNAETISWDQYIENIFACCTGKGFHEDDKKGILHHGHWALFFEDPFGFSIWKWCKNVPTMKDATPFEDVFKTHRKGSLDEVKQKLEALPEEYERDMRKRLAFLALQDRRADVLQHCLEKEDFPYESYFEDEANTVESDKDSETFKVLEGSKFRKIFPRKEKSAGSPREGTSPMPSDTTEIGWPFRGAKIIKSVDRAKRREEELLERARTFDVGGSHPVPW